MLQSKKHITFGKKFRTYKFKILNIMDVTARLYAFRYDNLKAYLFAALFIAGNLLLPQLCHLAPNGGLMLLPIYFFTLIAAYKYGLYVGLLTAVFSPLCNHWLFGMPIAEMLPVIMFKSVVLVVAASLVAKKFNKVSIVAIILAVLAYQFAGVLAEWLMVKDFTLALQDFRIGFPGILFQIFGGFLVLKAIQKY